MIGLIAALLAVVTTPYAPVSYACDGSTATFTVNFPYLTQTDLTITSTTAGGAVTNLVLTTDYTLNLSSTQSTATLTLTSPSTKCPSGNTLRIARNMPLTQPQGFRAQTVFNPAIHETSLDRVEMQVQQVNSNVANPVLPSVLTNSTQVTARGEVTAIQLQDWFATAPSVRGYGAVGDGVTDDTAAIQLALNSSSVVRCSSGDTYLITGGLTSSIVAQAVNFSGCTLTLKTGSASHGMLTLSGAGSRVTGGTWDLNVAGNSSGDPFSYFAVMLGADRTVAESMYVKNSFGIGIKALAGVNYVEARFNRTENTALAGIFFDGSAIADALGNAIHHNKIDISANPSAVGAYITSASPYTFVQRRWRIQDNDVFGPTGSSSAVPITGRGMDGIVSGNNTNGGDIGVSVDISAADEGTIVATNRVAGMNGTNSFGIEVNGAKALTHDNLVRGGRIGVTGSSTGTPSTSMDYQQITNNLLVEQTVNAIWVAPGTGKTAQHLNISSNTIVSTLTAQNGAIRLAGDCRFSIISINQIKGPGSGNAGAVGVFLDTVNGNVQITGNHFESWLQASVAFNAGVVAQTQIAFTNNDVSNDVGNQSAGLVSLSGLATMGTGVQILNNFRGVSGTLKDDYLDVATNIRAVVANTWTSPEGNLTAGPGSTYQFTSGGSTNFYTKVSGTGATGWAGLVPGTITLAAGSGTLSVRSGAACTCTDTTANASVKCTVAATTLTATGTGTDVIQTLCF